MRVVLQRVKHAQVKIDNMLHGKIAKGLLLLVGIEDSDDDETLNKIAKKCVELRIFEDAQGKMNLSVQDVKGAILSVSQFTLFADCRKGRRPSFTKAGNPAFSSEMYERFNQILRSYGIEVQTGIFKADMQVELLNDGPVTIILDSKEI